MKFPKLLTDKPTAAGSTPGSTTSTEPWAAYLMTQVATSSPAYDGLTPAELDTAG